MLLEDAGILSELGDEGLADAARAHRDLEMILRGRSGPRRRRGDDRKQQRTNPRTFHPHLPFIARMRRQLAPDLRVARQHNAGAGLRSQPRDTCATAARRGDLNRLCNANLVYKSILQNWVGSAIRCGSAGCFCLSRHGWARRSGRLGHGNCSIARGNRRANRRQTNRFVPRRGRCPLHARTRVLGSGAIVFRLILTMPPPLSVAGRPESGRCPNV